MGVTSGPARQLPTNPLKRLVPHTKTERVYSQPGVDSEGGELDPSGPVRGLVPVLSKGTIGRWDPFVIHLLFIDIICSLVLLL